MIATRESYKQHMTKPSTPKRDDAGSDRWVIIRTFNRSGKTNGLFREHFELWKQMSHFNRLSYLGKKVPSRLPYSYEWAFEDRKRHGFDPSGYDPSNDETYRPENFPGPEGERLSPSRKYNPPDTRLRRSPSIVAVGFDRNGKRLCATTMSCAEWTSMDHDMRMWELSNLATGEVAYYQWRYVE